VTDPAAELDGKVTVKVAGDDVAVTRPPFRRLRPLLTLPGLQALADLPVDDEGVVQGNVPLDIVIDMGEAIGEVLWPGEIIHVVSDPADARMPEKVCDQYLDRIYTADQWGDFVSSAIEALQLGEAVASAKS
jgi:hypothetical protein